MTTFLRRLAAAWVSAVGIGFGLAGVAHFVRAPSVWSAIRRYQDWYDPFNVLNHLRLFLLLAPALLAFGASEKLAKRSLMHPATPSKSYALITLRWLLLLPVAAGVTCVSYLLAAITLDWFWQGERGAWWDSFLSMAACPPAGGTFVAVSCSVAPSLRRSVAILSTGAIVLLAAAIALFFVVSSRPGLLDVFLFSASVAAGAIVACIVMWRQESEGVRPSAETTDAT